MKVEDLRLTAGSTPISEAPRPEGIRTVSDVRDADAGVSSAQNDLWIFRDGSKLVSGKEMVRDLRGEVTVLPLSPRERVARSAG